MSIKLNEEKLLIALRAWSHWYRVVSQNPRYLPGLSLLKKWFDTALESLKSESRKTVIRLAKLNKCISCGKEIELSSGDHIIPLSKGGPQSAENFMPLCKHCNSSKGNKDLLEWWVKQGYHIKDLNHDALTIYLRLRYRLRISLPLQPLYETLKQAEETLPKELLDFWREKTEA